MTERSLLLTFIALVVLAALSWSLAFTASVPLALGIAAIKAVLIGRVFMELAHAHAATRFVALIAVMFLVLLCSGVLSDVVLRT